MPPISDKRQSRLRFLDLAPLLADVRGGAGTAFVPESARVLRTRDYGFYDEPYIEKIVFSRRSCPMLYDDGLSTYSSNLSRAEVSFEVDPEKPDCAFPVPEEGLTLYNVNEQCGLTVLPDETTCCFEFEPQCMVLVLSAAHERQMFNEMMAAGRQLTEDFQISVNFTLGTGPTPDVKLVSTNCHNSHVLLRNHELDTTGQADRDALLATRDSIDIYTELIEFTRHVRDSQSIVSIDPATGFATLLPPSPTPPPPPPPTPGGPDGSPAPPAPPEQVTRAVQLERYEREKAELEARAEALATGLADCFAGDRADEVVCGMSSDDAPDPWLAADGTPCLGNATKQARSKDYCGFWDSAVNPLAADADLRAELLEAGPYCLGEDGTTALVCNPNATRTQRSGVYDVEYMVRPDRRYWCAPPKSLLAPPTRTLTRCALPWPRDPVCARPARARGHRRRRRHRAVPRQPDRPPRRVRAQLRRLPGRVHEPGRARARRRVALRRRAQHARPDGRVPLDGHRAGTQTRNLKPLSTP